MEKINKNNSVLNDEYWIETAINDGRLDLLPVYKPVANLSVGEFIELGYVLQDNKKVTKKNSILFEKLWVEKYYEAKLPIPRERLEGYSLGEQLELEYDERIANQTEKYEHLRYLVK